MMLFLTMFRRLKIPRMSIFWSASSAQGDMITMLGKCSFVVSFCSLFLIKIQFNWCWCYCRFLFRSTLPPLFGWAIVHDGWDDSRYRTSSAGGRAIVYRGSWNVSLNDGICVQGCCLDDLLWNMLLWARSAKKPLLVFPGNIYFRAVALLTAIREFTHPDVVSKSPSGWLWSDTINPYPWPGSALCLDRHSDDIHYLRVEEQLRIERIPSLGLCLTLPRSHCRYCFFHKFRSVLFPDDLALFVGVLCALFDSSCDG